MDKIIISVGTNSEKKISYLQEILKEIGVNAEIIPNKVASDVSDQPMSEEETLTGSINRANKAIKTNSHANCGLDIEVGYDKNKEGYYKIFAMRLLLIRIITKFLVALVNFFYQSSIVKKLILI